MNRDRVGTLRRVLDHDRIRDNHKVDHYYVVLNEVPLSNIVSQSAYWYSLFSHRRGDYKWKGFLQLKLGDNKDTEARAELELMNGQGG